MNLNDPAVRRDWLDGLRSAVLDLLAVAADAGKPRKARFFSRGERQRRVAELERVLLATLDAAATSARPLALVPPLEQHPEPSDPDADSPPSTLRPS